MPASRERSLRGCLRGNNFQFAFLINKDALYYYHGSVVVVVIIIIQIVGEQWLGVLNAKRDLQEFEFYLFYNQLIIWLNLSGKSKAGKTQEDKSVLNGQINQSQSESVNNGRKNADGVCSEEKPSNEPSKAAGKSNEQHVADKRLSEEKPAGQDLAQQLQVAWFLSRFFFYLEIHIVNEIEVLSWCIYKV